MRAIAIFILLLFAVPAFSQQAQTPPPELERVERTLQTLTDLKSKVAAIEAQIDQLIAELSEQSKPKAARCAAMTAKGERCTRPSVAGSRYCRQHQMAHQ